MPTFEEFSGPIDSVALAPGKHEGLVSFATFEKIQTRLKGGARAPNRKDISADFPLRGFIACNDCGSPLTACWSKSKTGRKYPYYLCPTKGCASYRKSIPRDRLEGEFEALLHRLELSDSLYALAKAMFRDAWDHRMGRAADAAKALQREIAKIERQIEQLLDRVVDAATRAWSRSMRTGSRSWSGRSWWRRRRRRRRTSRATPTRSCSNSPSPFCQTLGNCGLPGVWTCREQCSDWRFRSDSPIAGMTEFEHQIWPYLSRL